MLGFPLIKLNKIMSSTPLAIVVATYMRKDGSTPFYLDRALSSIFSQTYQNFKIFLIGDKYENESQLLDIISSYDKSRIFFENLPIAKERDSYTGNTLWSYGGVNARNYGVKKAISEGFEYVCHIDHDDWWYDIHLESINKCITETNSDWICTLSTYLNPNRMLPVINETAEYIDFLPRSCGLIHSSVCMNYKTIPLEYRDLYLETGVVGQPSDADLWNRCNAHITQNKLKSTLINKLTCRHDEEGYGRTN